MKVSYTMINDQIIQGGITDDQLIGGLGDDSVAGIAGADIITGLDHLPEFQARFADRAWKHLTNNGALTNPRNRSRFSARVTELDDAITGESAPNARMSRSQYSASRSWLSLRPSSTSRDTQSPSRPMPPIWSRVILTWAKLKMKTIKKLRKKRRVILKM